MALLQFVLLFNHSGPKFTEDLTTDFSPRRTESFGDERAAYLSPLKRPRAVYLFIYFNICEDELKIIILKNLTSVREQAKRVLTS